MMDKQELIEFLDGEIRSVKDNIAFKEGMNWCAQLVEKYLDLNDEPEITTEQAWEKIAEDKGYTIVKEPVWIVKINKKLYFCRFTDKYFKENPDEPTYSESGNPELVKKFTDKAKAEAVATLINGEVEEWSE